MNRSFGGQAEAPERANSTLLRLSLKIAGQKSGRLAGEVESDRDGKVRRRVLRGALTALESAE